MAQIKILIADDEPFLREALKRELQSSWPQADLIAEAKNGVEALEMIQKLKPDIAFLDIKMPGLTGIEVAAEIAATCHIVFITAYDKYAVEAFDKGAVDYVLKPVEPLRFKKTIERLTKKINAAETISSTNLMQCLKELNGQNLKSAYLNYINVSRANEIRVLPVEKVQCFMAEQKYTTVVSTEGEWIIRKSIKELESELDPNKFWQVHRATIVRVDAIEKVIKDELEGVLIFLQGSAQKIAVSRSYAHLFKLD